MNESFESEKKPPISRERFCFLLARGLTEELGVKITFDEISEQLLLIEMGREPTNKVLGAWIKRYINQ